MGKILSFAVFVCILTVANAWGAAFMDDFDRPNGAVGNGWATQTDGTITVEIVDNEVLITGAQGTDWVRSGISRDVVGETRVSCDFKANENLNFHILVNDADTSAFLEIYSWGGPLIHANSPDGSWPGWTDITGSDIVAGEYNTVLLEFVDGEFTVTLNGTVVATLPNAGFTSIGNVLIASDAAAGTTGTLHIDNVQIGVIIEGTAKDPIPANGATDVPREVVLGWSAGEYAAKHDVYFGTSLDDVNSGDASVFVSPGQTATTFDPEDVLEFEQTYYWRVDEVNAPPDSSVLTGAVWSFTTEPYTYPLQNVTATASSSSAAKGMTPDKTVDGSGMTGDEHSTGEPDMWLSAQFTSLPAWIQYEFDDVYRLSELWVWNSNQSIESFIGFGAKDVTIEYSLDGVEWNSLGDVEFAQAPGEVGYTPNTTVDLAGVQAKFVRLTITSNWRSMVQQVGLSEVRFFYVPIKARQPNPASGDSGVPLDAVLTWRPGREATSHDVYFSDDRDAVADGTAPVETVSTTRFEPTGLEFGLNYYWKVNEVSDAGDPSLEGDIWSFSTAEYMVVDDFESYTDDIDAGETIWQTWLDGLTNNTGSIVGYWEAPFAETSIVHGGRQSMPMDYNNVNSPYYSEAERTFDPVQDWTVNGATDLTLYVQGNAAAFVETAPGQYQISANSSDIWGNSDNGRFVYKQLNGDGEISAKVLSADNTSDWAKGGVMIRESLNPASSYAFMFPTPSGIRAFQNRPSVGAGAISAHSAAGEATYPFWVKVERKGNVFTAYYSTDGTNWIVQPDTENTGTDASPNPQTISMSGTVYIGLALTSNNSKAGTCVAEFSDVLTSGSVSGQWNVADLGDVAGGNDTDDLYVVIQDSSNKTAVVTHPDPAAVNATDWIEWRIPYSDLAGVNLTRVQTIYIGVGDRDNPQPDGAGRLFIDDIRVGRPLAAPPAIPGNFLINGDFEDGVMDPWSVYGDATAEVVSDEAVEGASSLHITVNSPGANFWDAGLQQAGPVFQGGKQYTLSAFLKCSEGTLDINFKPELAADPWTGYGDQVFTMTDEWTEFSVTTPVFADDTSPTSITFHIGFAAADFWIDGVRFYEGEYVAPGEE